MATIKVSCPKCGQKVSGDESFYGTKVECPVCSADIQFPGQRREAAQSEIDVVPPEEDGVSPSPGNTDGLSGLPQSDFEAPPQTMAPEADTPIPLGGPASEDDAYEDEGLGEVPSPVFGAIAMVSAVLALVTCVGGILFAPISIICGHMALAKARHSPVQPAPGHTLGAIGLIIGYVSLFLTIVTLVILVFFIEPIRQAFEGFSDPRPAG
ncbi:MAG: hypothetical protein CMO55_09530 [Verrucomicrobiales bacterium]|nr:hypothetical protein [Verrucomicrobiales bacterium]